MSETFFEYALRYFRSDDEDIDFNMFYKLEGGYHTIEITDGVWVGFFQFDDGIVDSLNSYLSKLWLETEGLYDDVEEFLLDIFFSALEEIIDDADDANMVAGFDEV